MNWWASLHRMWHKIRIRRHSRGWNLFRRERWTRFCYMSRRISSWKRKTRHCQASPRSHKVSTREFSPKSTQKPNYRCLHSRIESQQGQLLEWTQTQMKSLNLNFLLLSELIPWRSSNELAHNSKMRTSGKRQSMDRRNGWKIKPKGTSKREKGFPMTQRLTTGRWA